MSFVNTVDLIGDEALAASIIDRNIAGILDHKVTSIGAYAFYRCTQLAKVDFSLVTSVDANAFANCSQLATLVLRSETRCSLVNTNAFKSTPIASGTGYIYVPAALVDSYKAASNWSTYANQFRAIEDYTVDGTTTGELDPTKI